MHIIYTAATVGRNTTSMNGVKVFWIKQAQPSESTTFIHKLETSTMTSVFFVGRSITKHLLTVVICETRYSRFATDFAI